MIRKFKVNKKLKEELLQYNKDIENILNMTLSWDGEYLTGNMNDWKVYCPPEILQEYIKVKAIIEI